jgi:hypothetical protein
MAKLKIELFKLFAKVLLRFALLQCANVPAAGAVADSKERKLFG